MKPWIKFAALGRFADNSLKSAWVGWFVFQKLICPNA